MRVDDPVAVDVAVVVTAICTCDWSSRCGMSSSVPSSAGELADDELWLSKSVVVLL